MTDCTTGSGVNGRAAPSIPQPRRPVSLPGLVACGLLLLLLGLAVTAASRPAGHAMLLPLWAVPRQTVAPGAWTGWLPSFAHACGFALLTAVALPRRAAWHSGTCAAWWAVNVGFEVGQHPAMSGPLVETLERSRGAEMLTQPLAAYLARGTFDPADLLAATLGALAAAVLLSRARPDREAPHAAA